jgi:hypothetical protein
MADAQAAGDLKVILLGDSAVGKSKLLERYVERALLLLLLLVLLLLLGCATAAPAFLHSC